MATRVKDAAKGIVEVVFLIQDAEEIRVERTEAQIRETPAGRAESHLGFSGNVASTGDAAGLAARATGAAQQPTAHCG
jgi:hypothetical protein